MTPLSEIFSWVCGQEHVWVLGGEELPFCQRCTGLYVGALPALLACILFRLKPNKRLLWTHGMFLLLMVPFGYHLVPQMGVIRTLTGQLFAMGLVYYLLLLPGDHWRNWRENSASGEAAYYALGVVSVLGLQIAVHWGAARTLGVISWLGFAGLLLYASLLSLNCVLLGACGRQVLQNRARRTEV